MRKDVARGIYNELPFHSVRLGGYVCMPTRSSEASSFGFARKCCSEFVLLIKFLFYLFIFLNLASGWLL